MKYVLYYKVISTKLHFDYMLVSENGIYAERDLLTLKPLVQATKHIIYYRSRAITIILDGLLNRE